MHSKRQQLYCKMEQGLRFRFARMHSKANLNLKPSNFTARWSRIRRLKSFREHCVATTWSKPKPSTLKTLENAF